MSKLRSIGSALLTLSNFRNTLKEVAERQEAVRKRVGDLEARAKVIEKQLERFEPAAQKASPMLAAVMKEGLPLELFSRLALIEQGCNVHGYFPYLYHDSTEGRAIERSVDVYATNDRTYTVPPDGGRRAGDSWPERDHVLIEAKQRRPGVAWIFTQLPTSRPPSSFGANGVPRVNAGFEVKPGDGASKAAGNAKDVENALAQLQSAYMPLLVRIDEEWKRDHKQARGHRLTPGTRRDTVRLALVTTARLLVFKPPAHLAALESEKPPKDDELFEEVPWVLFNGEPSIHLKKHQAWCVHHLRVGGPGADGEEPVLHVDHCPEVHIVNFHHVQKFFAFVADPPRIKKIVMQMTVDGKRSDPFTIE